MNLSGFMAVTALSLKFGFIQQLSQELKGSNPVVCSWLRRGSVGTAGVGQLPGSLVHWHEEVHGDIQWWRRGERFSFSLPDLR